MTTGDKGDVVEMAHQGTVLAMKGRISRTSVKARHVMNICNLSETGNGKKNPQKLVYKWGGGSKKDPAQTRKDRGNSSGCPLTSTPVLWHAYTHTHHTSRHSHTYIHIQLCTHTQKMF